MTCATHNALFQRATQRLAALPEWAPLIAAIGPCRHRVRPEREPYEALMRAIAYQQLTGKAGDAILARLRDAFHLGPTSFPSAQQLIAIDRDVLRRCGFSSRKTETLKAIATGAISGLVPSRSAAALMTDECLIKQLTTIPGIGRWTVEMLLIYTLERMDIMPLDDFGIVQGLHYLYAPTSLLKKSDLRTLSEHSAPYRTIAAWYLWRIPQLPAYPAFKAARLELKSGVKSPGSNGI